MASIPVHNPVVQILVDPSDGTELVSVNDAARLMSVGRRTVYYWIARELVEVRQAPGGKIYIEVASLWKSTGREPVSQESPEPEAVSV